MQGKKCHLAFEKESCLTGYEAVGAFCTSDTVPTKKRFTPARFQHHPFYNLFYEVFFLCMCVC